MLYNSPIMLFDSPIMQQTGANNFQLTFSYTTHALTN